MACVCCAAAPSIWEQMGDRAVSKCTTRRGRPPATRDGRRSRTAVGQCVSQTCPRGPSAPAPTPSRCPEPRTQATPRAESRRRVRRRGSASTPRSRRRTRTIRCTEMEPTREGPVQTSIGREMSSDTAGRLAPCRRRSEGTRATLAQTADLTLQSARRSRY